MGKVIKTTVEIKGSDDVWVLLPAYRFQKDAKKAQRRLVELEGVEAARIREIPVEE